MKFLFDRKVSDKTLKGYNADEVKRLFSDVKEIDSLKYYYYLPNSKFPRESKSLKRQQTEQALSFLESRFSESTSLFTEIQRKEFQSGRSEIIFKGRNPKGEIIKLCILNIKRTAGVTTTAKG